MSGNILHLLLLQESCPLLSALNSLLISYSKVHGKLWPPLSFARPGTPKPHKAEKGFGSPCIWVLMKTVDLVQYAGKGATSWGLDQGIRSPGARGGVLCTGRPAWVGRRLSNAAEVGQAVGELTF